MLRYHIVQLLGERYEECLHGDCRLFGFRQIFPVRQVVGEFGFREVKGNALAENSNCIIWIEIDRRYVGQTTNPHPFVMASGKRDAGNEIFQGRES